MVMQPKNWELAAQEIAPAKYEKPLAGRQIVKILNAVHDKDLKRYTLTLWTQLNEATTDIIFYLTRKSKINPQEYEVNDLSMRSLNTLAKAIYGPEGAAACTIPNPEQIIGCAVGADIKLNQSVWQKPVFDENQQPVLNEDGTQKTEPKDRTYVNIYEFFAIAKEDVDFYSDHKSTDADGGQYYIVVE